MTRSIHNLLGNFFETIETKKKDDFKVVDCEEHFSSFLFLSKTKIAFQVNIQWTNASLQCLLPMRSQIFF